MPRLLVFAVLLSTLLAACGQSGTPEATLPVPLATANLANATALTPTLRVTPLHRAATVGLRDFRTGQTLYLMPQDTFMVDSSVIGAVFVADERIVARDSFRQGTYKALAPGQTKLETTYSLCQGITNDCGGPTMTLVLKIIVQESP